MLWLSLGLDSSEVQWLLCDALSHAQMPRSCGPPLALYELPESELSRGLRWKQTDALQLNKVSADCSSEDCSH